MTQQYWWITAAHAREIVDARVAEAERDRLARRAQGPGRSTRARVAGALRAIANRLDGETRPAGERRLSPAPAR